MENAKELILVIAAALCAGLLWHYPIKMLMIRLWGRFYKIPHGEEQIGGKRLHQEVQPFISMLGILERMVYAGSWLLHAPEIIAVLLALKATPSLKEWSEKKVLGRAQFNIWLIGNLLSVIGSIITAEILKSIYDLYFA
jgi:hypothetical protein